MSKAKSLWKEVRKYNGETIAVPLPPSQEFKALYILDGSSEQISPNRFKYHTILAHMLRRSGWEIANGKSLEELPEVLVRSVDEYALIVILVPSSGKCIEHEKQIVSLSSEFPFVIVVDGLVTTLRTQCPTLMSTSEDEDFVRKLLEAAALLTLRGVTVNAASVASEGVFSSIALPPNASAQLVKTAWWTAEVSKCPVTFPVTISIDTDAEVDGKYAGGLLKLVLPAARIRLILDKKGIVTIRMSDDDKSSNLFARVRTPIAEAMNVSTASLRQIGPRTFCGDVPVADVNDVTARIRALYLDDVEAVGPAFKFAVTAPPMVYFTMLALHVSEEVDDDVSLKVEEVGCPDSDPQLADASQKPVSSSSSISSLSVPQSKSTPLPEPNTYHVTSNSRNTPTEASANTTTTSTATATAPRNGIVTPSPFQVTAQLVVPQAPPPLVIPPLVSAPYPSITPDEIARMVQEQVAREVERSTKAIEKRHDATVAALQDEISLLKAQHAATLDKEVELEMQIEDLRKELGETMRIEGDRQASLSELQHQIDLIKDSAADHSLVESALNDIRSRAATKDGIREAEERFAQTTRAIQQQSESAANRTEGLRGHVEAIMLQLQQVVQRVERLQHTEGLERTLDESLNHLDDKLKNIEMRQSRYESEDSVFRKAFEVGLNRLYDQLKIQHEVTGRIDGLYKLQAGRVDEIQKELRSMDGTVRRCVDEAITNTSALRTQHVQEQIASVKAYSMAAVERSAELQNEKLVSIEKRLATDMQRAIELVRRQQNSDIQRIHDMVDQQMSSSKRLAEELQQLSPAKLAGSPRKEELQLVKEQVERCYRDQEQIRARVKELELLQSEVSVLLGDEQKRDSHLDEVTKRVEDLEASVIFIESRI